MGLSRVERRQKSLGSDTRRQKKGLGRDERYQKEGLGRDVILTINL